MVTRYFLLNGNLQKLICSENDIRLDRTSCGDREHQESWGIQVSTAGQLPVRLVAPAHTLSPSIIFTH